MNYRISFWYIYYGCFGFILVLGLSSIGQPSHSCVCCLKFTLSLSLGEVRVIYRWVMIQQSKKILRLSLLNHHIRCIFQCSRSKSGTDFIFEHCSILHMISLTFPELGLRHHCAPSGRKLHILNISLHCTVKCLWYTYKIDRSSCVRNENKSSNSSNCCTKPSLLDCQFQKETKNSWRQPQIDIRKVCVCVCVEKGVQLPSNKQFDWSIDTFTCLVVF